MLTYFFIGITVVVSMYAFSNQKLYKDLLFNPYEIARRQEWHRFVTSGFVHNGTVHLLFNMLTLYFFGVYLEYYHYILNFGTLLGYVYFALLYLGGIIVSDIPNYLKYKGTPYYNSLGASGGVSAVIFSSILYEPLSKVYLYFAIPVPAFIMGGVYLIYSYFYSKGSNDNINHTAHLVGALYGLAFSIVIKPTAIADFFGQIALWRLF